MSTNFTNTTKIEKVLEENSLFVISDSKVSFKNCDAVINLNQISNSRLIKNRDLSLNIIILVFSTTLYLVVLPLLNFGAVFKSLIVILILISVILAICIKCYSYKLLINKSNYNFNEITISKKNLYFAGRFISKFADSALLKNKVEQEFEIDYRSLKEA
jgi:glucan phosphoethanolaminetransferase (alkaline phosphatase superfamily)